MKKVERPNDRVVSSILRKGWQVRPVVKPDRPPHYVVNIRGEPLRALPTIMATQQSRAFREPRLGTVVRCIAKSSKEESREVNLDEKSKAMGYSSEELRKAEGLDDSRLAAVLGLAMDRRAMELLFAVGEASRRALPHSVESPCAEAVPDSPVDPKGCEVQQRAIQVAEWVQYINPMPTLKAWRRL
ncbi:hypothetical protein CYMTET_25096 [Cymbomonas tetramitiformis]|uniref:Uncharacterized protein n=1 Tax=Cymbomonas tetramitiformis TaxID=36881 RepID=A0AAE0KZ91_9CHLO|nr:hypothetical protein CYMTET_25096 [Cymbomonas tetramitiformis]